MSSKRCNYRQMAQIIHKSTIIEHHFKTEDVYLQQNKIVMVKVLWLINLFLN